MAIQTIYAVLHIVLGFGVLKLGRAGLLSGFRLYSSITVGAIAVMGAVGGATVETPYAGLVERIAAIVTQQWLFVLGLRLLLW